MDRLASQCRPAFGGLVRLRRPPRTRLFNAVTHHPWGGWVLQLIRSMINGWAGIATVDEVTRHDRTNCESVAVVSLFPAVHVERGRGHHWLRCRRVKDLCVVPTTRFRRRLLTSIFSLASPGSLVSSNLFL